MKQKKKKRVIVAMSSGVDSSVAAAMLKKQGYDVIGIFMHFWKEPGQDSLRENKCCSIEAQQDARKVAHILDIPLYTANVAREFKKEVVDYFLSENASGRTPNPCVVCNERIKFNFLFRKMLEMKADFVASGHYAQIKKSKVGKKNIYRLFQGEDKSKDQTYFLYNLTQKQLAKILFPVGGHQKMDIRGIAEGFKLPVFDKDDSQGLCFTPEKYPTEFLRRHLKLKKGNIMDVDGKILGKHEGLALYTIGQRRGINIGGTGPYYVVEKDFKNNILLVTNNDKHPLLFRASLVVEKTNWIVAEPASTRSHRGEPKLPAKIMVKIRYRNEPVSAIIKKVEGIKNKKKTLYEVVFDELQWAVTSGQSAVFYSKNNELIGGGVIR